MEVGFFIAQLQWIFLLVKIMGHNAIQIPININQLNLDTLPNTPISYDSHFMAWNLTLSINKLNKGTHLSYNDNQYPEVYRHFWSDMRTVSFFSFLFYYLCNKRVVHAKYGNPQVSQPLYLLKKRFRCKWFPRRFVNL